MPKGTHSLIARKELRARATLGSVTAAEKGECARRWRGFYREVYGGGHPRSRRFISEEGKREKETDKWTYIPQVIRFFHRTVSVSLSLSLAPLASSIFFTLFVLVSLNYSPRYTFSGFGSVLRLERGGGGDSFAPRIEPRTIK